LATLKEIENFTSEKNIAIVGVSRDKKKFGNYIYRILLEKGYNAVAINPNANIIEDKPCFNKISELSNETKSILIVTKKEHSQGLVQEAIDKGIKNIWIQKKLDTPEAINIAKQNNANIVTGECILMFTDPEGIHKFHRNIKKIFGSLPK